MLQTTQTMRSVIQALSDIRISVVSEESELQEQVAAYLCHAGVPFMKEYRLGSHSRIDFMLPGGVGIEVKKGKPSKRQVLAQLERYARFEEVRALVFVIERCLDVPRQIAGKPCVCIALNKLWGVALP